MTKILLVEDDKSLREIYGVRLLAEGYDIVSAGDGEEALAMAIKERPQLIVSDVMMPKISGFDMLDILRSTTETKNIKVIMMTALSSDDQRERGEQLGADRYLVKSQVGIEDVVRTVHEVLGDAPVAKSVFGTEQQPAPAANSSPQPQQPAQTATPTPAASQPTQQHTAPQAQPQSQQPTPTHQQPPVAPGQQATSPTPQPQGESAAHFPPQPTAPFASPRPATLGERVIQPLDNTPFNNNDDIADRIAAELDGVTLPSQTPETTAPAAAHAEATPIPINVPQEQVAPHTPDTAPQPAAAPTEQPQPVSPQPAPPQETSAPETSQPPQQPPQQ